MKQKFKKLSFVKVIKEMPEYMSHFDSDFIAIVGGTYSQLYEGTDINNYNLYKVENGKVINNISWYEEDQLTLLPDQDRDKAEEMIEDFNFR